MVNIVLFGAPGAGKGTQAARLSEKYSMTHISTGDIIRKEIYDMTHRGLMVKEILDRGELAPDELVLEIIREHMLKHNDGNGNIFDGFPRTLAQAEAFDTILGQHGLKIDTMIELVVPEEELVRRILLRGHESCRADDTHEDIIRNRIRVYNAHTAIVAEYYREQGKYIGIDGCASQDGVTDAISKHLDKLF